MVVVDSGGASVVVVVKVLDVVVVEEVDVVVLLVLEVVDEVVLLGEDDEVVAAPVPPLHAAAIRAMAMGAANRRIWFSMGAAHGNPCETQRNHAWDTPRHARSHRVQFRHPIQRGSDHLPSRPARDHPAGTLSCAVPAEGR